MIETIIISSIQVIVVMMCVLTGCAYSTWLERKVVGHMQHRFGPTFAGPYGLLQPLADAVKLIFKEDIIPSNVERITYALAPMLAFIPSMLSFAVIPFSPDFTIFGRHINGMLSDLNIGILFVFAVTSLGVYGIILAGWSSGSKYSLLGGIRSSAQMISYEVSYGLTIIGVILVAGTLSMREIVQLQEGGIWHWFVFRGGQLPGFLLYLTCAVAETNRAPFDLPEAESELVGGYHTEYSSMRFSLFFIGEYANMLAVSCVGTTLFWGGWQSPLPWNLPWYLGGDGLLWFLAKVFCFMFFYIWLRATFPRFRYDQLMNFGWKVLFPLAIANTVITGYIVLALR